jgi:hypothetical protein
MKAGAVIGIADIHAWPLADRIEALEDLDRFGVIVRGSPERLLAGGFGHAKTFESAGSKTPRTGA